ncbi:MAG TPA: saccharopine dehydrogenase NADP-binding domain-containing protein [Kofleriaceae bacterium]|nr:saccharopine dehydrogenase NADP-binding domain-containing protein [Kofleriaceae bacterium]
MTTTTREFDLVLFGASGFTGRLVAEYLARAPDRPRWAIAGRDRAKLEALGLSVQVLVADAHDRPALDALARRTKVVCTTVGPYARHGSELVAACAEAGTHYCDLTGEVPWMRRMIDRHHARAAATGARIVHTCGFDSIPSDLGTWAAQQEFIARFGRPAQRVTALFGEASGGISGGTAASGLELAAAADHDLEVRRLVGDPYALDPEPRGPRPPAPDDASIGWNRHLRMFTVPFLMAQVNTRVVRRAHALAGLPWGEGFVYREVMSTPGSARGAVMAAAVTAGLGGISLALRHKRLRELLAQRLPKPGEGPSRERREHGHWKTRFVAEAGTNGSVEVLVYTASDRADPGYGSTAKMLGESALCLALDPLTSPGGVTTPSLAMGGALLDRLRRAGLTFAVAG